MGRHYQGCEDLYTDAVFQRALLPAQAIKHARPARANHVPKARIRSVVARSRLESEHQIDPRHRWEDAVRPPMLPQRSLHASPTRLLPDAVTPDPRSDTSALSLLFCILKLDRKSNRHALLTVGR